MTRAVDTMATATCSCGYTITANADRLRCPECKAWITLSHSAPSRKLQLEQRREQVDTSPLPRDQWPAWATVIARFYKPEDTGVGDTVQRIAAAFGGEFFKTFAASIGMPCGCTQRQAQWNTRYPYESKPSQR